MRPIDADALIADIKECIEIKDSNFEWEQTKGLKVALSCIDEAQTVQPEIIHCKDCIHRPIVDDPDAKDGFGLLFPDFMCPCRCDDGYYSWMPNDNWFCGNGEKEAVKDE